jgi:signal transduction histidine kinase
VGAAAEEKMSTGILAYKKGSDPTRLVWLLIFISFTAGVVLVCIFWWSLNNIRTEKEKLISERESFTNVRTRFESRLVQKQLEIATLLDGNHEAFAGETDSSLRDLVEEYQLKADSSGTKDSFIQLNDLVGAISELSGQCYEWAGEYSKTIHKLPLLGRKSEEFLNRIGEVVDKIEGQQRLKQAVQIRSYRKGGAEEKADVPQSIIKGFSSVTDLSTIRRDVADLALLRERLHSSIEADNLLDLKDNEFRTLLARLRRNAAFLQNDPVGRNTLVHQLLDQFEEVLFGKGYWIDNDHQTIVPGIGGEYTLSVNLMNLREGREELQRKASNLFSAFNKALLAIATEAEFHARQEVARVERALTGAWTNMLFVGIVTNVLFLMLCFKIIKAIKRQIRAIEESNIQLDAKSRELQRSEERLRKLSSDLIHVQENERRRISRELHDELGQSLAAMKMHVGSVKRRLGSVSDDELAEECQDIRDTISQIIENVRRLSRDLSPVILEDLSLMAAIESLLNNFSKVSNISTTLESADINHYFNESSERNIYRVLQEALTNISKHAQAASVSLSVEVQQQQVYFIISDDGCGFNVDQVLQREGEEKGMGLTAMYERARILKGDLDIQSEQGRGTTITLTVPLGYEGEGNEAVGHSAG